MIILNTHTITGIIGARKICDGLNGGWFELLMGIVVWIGREFQIRLELFIISLFALFSVFNLTNIRLLQFLPLFWSYLIAIFRLRGSNFLFILCVFFVLLPPIWSMFYSLLWYIFFKYFSRVIMIGWTSDTLRVYKAILVNDRLSFFICFFLQRVRRLVDLNI